MFSVQARHLAPLSTRHHRPATMHLTPAAGAAAVARNSRRARSPPWASRNWYRFKNVSPGGERPKFSGDELMEAHVHHVGNIY